MTLQTKLTLGSVLLATLIVTLVSAVDLGNLMQVQFTSTLDRAELVKGVATEAVKDTLNRPRQPVMREALQDPGLTERLLKLVGQSKSISEILIVAQPPPEIVLASTVTEHLGQQVQIAGGPFDGIVATIIEMDEKDRLVVLLQLMNRPIKVKVNSGAVMPA